MGWGVLALLIAAGGDPRISVDVEWDAPETCPPRARFEAELRARSSRLRIVTPPDASEAHVSVKVVERNKKFSAVSKLRTTLSGVTTREFKSAQCETLVQAAALATSMLLDPEGTKLGQVSLPPPEEPDAGAPEPLPIDAGVTEPPPPPPERTPLDAGAALVDAGVAPELDAGVTVIEAPPPPPASSVHVELGAGGGFTSAVSSLIDPLIQLEAAVSFERLRVELTPQLIIGRKITNTRGTAQYFALGGRVAACFTHAWASWFRAELGGTLSVLAVPVSAPDAELPGSATGLQVAPGILVRAALTFGKFRVSVEGNTGLNTRTNAWVITGSGAVFSSPLFFSSGVVAVGWTL